ncbi:uncharacterized protein LOC62_07G009007 [Vanrija pseudolonga]|uniref:Uncharacterized protein n=1 Tax=Vanrija pseudolonga TaxID=143232 RepID=A0AAF0YFN8_9TREE|nr:hypothetical protein LOC62_07G009007 [Vanrija pseudolonga]
MVNKTLLWSTGMKKRARPSKNDSSTPKTSTIKQGQSTAEPVTPAAKAVAAAWKQEKTELNTNMANRLQQAAKEEAAGATVAQKEAAQKGTPEAWARAEELEKKAEELAQRAAKVAALFRVTPKGAPAAPGTSWFNALAQILVYSKGFTRLLQNHDCHDGEVFKGLHDYAEYTEEDDGSLPRPSLLKVAEAMEEAGIVPRVSAADPVTALYHLLIHLDVLSDPARPFWDLFYWQLEFFQHCLACGFDYEIVKQQRIIRNTIMTDDLVKSYVADGADVITTQSLFWQGMPKPPVEKHCLCGGVATVATEARLSRCLALSYTYPDSEGEPALSCQVAVSRAITFEDCRWSLVGALFSHQPVDPEGAVHFTAIIATWYKVYHVSDDTVNDITTGDEAHNVCLNGDDVAPFDVQKLKIAGYQQPRLILALYES